MTEKQWAQLNAVRRQIHRHPETSWEEFETTRYIRSILSQIEGVEIAELGLKTGVVASLKGSKPGECVALRADIDAIDVVERWPSSCMSEAEGKGHLCGHDFHTAALLGVAMLLSEQRDRLHGEVVFVFQPAEETTDGAQYVIEHGLFERFGIKGIFGLHNRPEVETGKVVVHTGPLMAAKVNFSVVVHGVGGHGSMPHRCVDPIVCAAAIVQAVLTIPSRNVDPMSSLVLSICSIHGGTPKNLIVDHVEMTGSMRYHDAEVGRRAMTRLRTVIEATAASFECQAEFRVDAEVDAVVHTPQMASIARRVAVRIFGEDSVIDAMPCMATEDFSAYLRHVPGFFYWVGCRKPDEAVYAWHNDMFHVDEDALPYASRLLSESAVVFLETSCEQAPHTF